MLTALDHIVLLCRDFESTLAKYSLLFGAPPSWRTESDQTQSALFVTGNTGFEILAPIGGRDSVDRFDEILGGRDSKVTSLVFATDDIESVHHILGRRGLNPSEISQGTSQDITRKATRKWQRFRCADNSCAGIKTFVMQNSSEKLVSALPNGLALDHLVINTPNPERAIAHYGGRLGIRFALDRTIEKFKTRFLFFRLDGLTLEIIHTIAEAHESSDPDTLWGLTWKVENIEKAHKRLQLADIHISDIRKGRKPGSRVFTVKSHTTGIPTLFINHAKRD